ncbi:MAG: EAL domain-containing protein [Xanthomonadaceae bacterium]|nr:EAL domain-containing protein [Xanthomonadaceae bacterium]
MQANPVPASSSDDFCAVLFDLGRLLARSLEPPALYEAVIEILESRIGARLVMVGELDRGSRWFRRVAPARLAPDMGDSYPEHLPFSFARPAFWRGEPQLDVDIRHAAGYEAFRQSRAWHGVASAAAVPIMQSGEVQAVLVVRSCHAGFFSPPMIGLLQQVASSIGLGREAHRQRMLLQQASQQEVRQRRAMRLLSETVRIVTRSVDEPSMLADACCAAKAIGNYPFAWVGLSEDAGGRTLRLPAHAGLAGAADAQTELALAYARHADAAVAIAMSTGQPQLWHPSPSGGAGWPGAGDGNPHAVLALPLSADGLIVGVFVIGAVAVDAFSAIEIRVLSEMAAGLGLGIEMRRAHEARRAEQKARDTEVERLAFYDVVTGLPNRRLLFDLLEQARAQAMRQQSLLAVGILDLDRFKSVNDMIGHAGGDRVLVEASARILGMLREADVVARFGGDEFALVICGLDSKEQLDAISRCILQALRTPFELKNEQVCISASVGWTLFPLDGSDAEGLVRHADLAMYAAKEEGKDRGLLYEPAMELEQMRLQAMRERIAQALVQSRLQLLYQPIVYIDGLPGLPGVAGMEALLRLQDDEQGLIEPADFMHVLDDPQLARPIGRYVLDEALRQCQAWVQAGISIPVSVNISTRHLLHPAFFNDIDAALDAYPQVMDVGFGIEVTETGPSMDRARAKVVIEECRRRGIRVGLDDFGTGSASLSHIQQLDIEHIKLDQSFVRDILSDERNMAIAAGVITTARMLAKAVIAEGIETLGQGDLLASLGCHQLQGFSISRPMFGSAVSGWVNQWVPPASWARLVNERQSLLAS